MNPLPPQERRFWLRVAAVSAVGLVMLITLEFTDVDRSLAQLSFDPVAHRFPLQNDPALAWWSHRAVKALAVAAFAWILIGVWRPLGMLRVLARPARIYLIAALVICLAVVSSLKRASALHCPWGLADFGGTAPYLRLFDPVPLGWVRGGCFPAGHVLSAFAFIGGFFALAPQSLALAGRWLAVVLIVGTVAGIAQQLRGAHFLSHTLWTLWWCWTLSALVAWFFRDRLRPVNRGVASAR